MSGISQASKSAVLIDPEAYDGSEEQFAASLGDSPASPRRPKFVVDPSADTDTSVNRQEHAVPLESLSVTESTPFADSKDAKRPIPSQQGVRRSGDTENHITVAELEPVVGESVSSPPVTTITEQNAMPAASLEIGVIQQYDSSFWKQEVAARVHSYRARRKSRGPKYPSLQLKFAPSESWATRIAENHMSTRPVCHPVAFETAEPVSAVPPAQPTFAAVPGARTASPQAALRETARIIEFPPSYSGAPCHADELAEPLIDRPRILEAPEVVPPLPALGGIILEPEEKEAEKRPGFEIPLQAAAMRRRLMASAIDGVLVLGAFALFAYILFKITAFLPPLPQTLGLAVAIIGIFWVGYQYLLLIYAGTTPGLRLAGLQLGQFDGSPPNRSLRRWRVLASVLSAVSLGLGFAWCFLDEDALCWHDRITHTYLAPTK